MDWASTSESFRKARSSARITWCWWKERLARVRDSGGDWPICHSVMPRARINCPPVQINASNVARLIRLLICLCCNPVGSRSVVFIRSTHAFEVEGPEGTTNGLHRHHGRAFTPCLENGPRSPATTHVAVAEVRMASTGQFIRYPDARTLRIQRSSVLRSDSMRFAGEHMRNYAIGQMTGT